MPPDKDVSEESEDNKPLFVGFEKSGQLFKSIDFSFDRSEITFGAKKVRLLRNEKRKDLSLPKDESKDQFQKAIESYSREMGAYLQGTNIIELIIPVFTSLAIKNNAHSFMKAKGTSLEQEGFELFELDTKHFSGFFDALRDGSQWLSFVNFLPKMTLTGIVSSYDGYLGNLIVALFSLKPELLSTSEKKFSVSEILGHANIDELKEQLVRKEVETVLRDSHEDHFSWFERKLKIDLRKDLSTWKDFVEICERRNLFTHTNGRVTQQYIDKCKSAGFKFKKEVKIGDKLGVSRKYLGNAAIVFYEIGMKLGHVVWRKVESSAKIMEPDKSYSNVCFELIQTKNYGLACSLLEFGITMPKLTEPYKSRMIVNYANSLKLNGKPDQAEKILSSKDWGASGLEYKICVAAVRDQTSAACRLMKQMGAHGEISKEGYLTWPVFINIRKEDEFREAYKEIFGSDLEEDELTFEKAEQKKAEEPARG